MFSLVAMAVMLYALYTYHWRAASIRTGGRGPYDDRLGPVSFRNKTLAARRADVYVDHALRCFVKYEACALIVSLSAS